jgi:hypothetical protein
VTVLSVLRRSFDDLASGDRVGYLVALAALATLAVAALSTARD